MQLDLAKLSAAIGFVNEVDAQQWRRHVLSVFAAQWAKELDAKKTTQVD